jgi:RNA polymerase sigma-70 factor (ECF subfamily)
MKKTAQYIDINDNKQIVSALNEGHESVFDAVYRHYFKKLCAFCSQYIPDLEETEEIVQETMVWLWENRLTLKAELTLKSLLFTIVKNKALNRISHYEIKQKVHEEIHQKYESTFENPDFYDQDELFRMYHQTLEKMPKDIRETFLMNRDRSLTHKEIAAILNVSPQTVNYRIGQALKMLRQALKDYLPFWSILLSSLI